MKYEINRYEVESVNLTLSVEELATIYALAYKYLRAPDKSSFYTDLVSAMCDLGISDNFFYGKLRDGIRQQDVANLLTTL